MSKSKLIIGIILIVVGGVLIPTGFFVNQMFVDQIAEGVPDALLAIEEEALPSLEEQLPPLATPDVLLGVEDGALTSLEAQLPVLTTPAVLDGLKDEFLAQLPFIINGSGAALAINQTITGIAGIIGFPAAKDQFFNSPTFQADYGYITPQGVSDYYDTLMGDYDVVNLGYTVTAQNNLLYGVGPLPGLITDIELGMGLLGYMELYLNVSLGDQTLNQTMQLYYNATWGQLEALAGYISNYLWEVVVKSTYSPQYTIEQYAELVFYAQWANASVVEDGIDLSLFKDTLPPDTKGFEAGVPNPTNITILTCMALWDDSNSSSFVNDSGILVWVGAMQGDLTLRGYLMGIFSLNSTQLLILLDWLGSFMTILVPLLLFDETGYTVPELAQFAFYEQWANGTIQGAAVLPGGFLNELSADFAGPPYFEVGLPSPSGLSLTETMNLWDEANAYTFVNMNGILVWLEAITNTTLQSTLITTFGISAGELTVLLTWLGAFFTVRVPQLIFYETGYTVPELAQIAFYEQWADGTIQGLSILPDGFLSERDPPIEGPPYFEVGLTEGPTGLTASQCDALWDETSEYSLVSASGINKWYQAESSSTTYDDLRTHNDDLSAVQMTKILDWLPKFRDEIVNALAKEELGLPMEPYALGNTLLIALGAGGGTLAVIGIVLLILSKRK
ncbi:MAG: hypothetical protein CEE42_07170 [Promethearchaeota archaeon Loki_b31]|nr:MAG: hypothetical protein CEE42_07170 [Candidatus Lokiarchaeota archaeon Loki_b31]